MAGPAFAGRSLADALRAAFGRLWFFVSGAPRHPLRPPPL